MKKNHHSFFLTDRFQVIIFTQKIMKPPPQKKKQKKPHTHQQHNPK